MALAMSEIVLLHARLAASEVRSRTAEVELAEARAVVSTSEAMIAHLRLEIAKLRREQYGRNSDIDPRAWLADVLARMPNLPDLLPWNWARGTDRRHLGFAR
ncbi:transposase domain-containing protein [Mesorhizobium sp.]|uniref:transposase domain-containing protein n=1 Tax=Mesorhizobium sp. TaxID=1871066 RepID=UPI0025D57E62|nr:transposase domain-containing protein [Mesorhizobium sp.]